MRYRAEVAPPPPGARVRRGRPKSTHLARELADAGAAKLLHNPAERRRVAVRQTAHVNGSVIEAGGMSDEKKKARLSSQEVVW